jgi:uncharacterized protein YjbI with pentapeptide repeats
MADAAQLTPAVSSANDPSKVQSADGATSDVDQPPLAAKARDLEMLRKTVEDASSVSGSLWLSYIFTLFYLLVAAGAVTHRDLFLENQVKLPFLNVDLPLRGFFALGPLIFVILHAYVLLHFAVLSGKISAFGDALRDQAPDEDTRSRLRRQLPSSIFVQLLAGPREVRRGVIGFLLRQIAWISLVIGPLVLLVFFELQFLPYHDQAITWWQRIMVLLDLVLLWLLWPKVLQARAGDASWRQIAAIAVCGVVSLLVLAIPFGVATFPGEWLARQLPYFPLRTELLEGETNATTRRPMSPLSNVLILPGLDAVDHVRFDTDDKIFALKETVSLRGRHLEGAVLVGADLRKADLTGAWLKSANLQYADLRAARFECGKPPVSAHGSTVVADPDSWDAISIPHIDPIRGRVDENNDPMAIDGDCPQLQGTLLDYAQLQGTWLEFAQLQGAHLDFAQLQGASLDGTPLQGASLHHANLQGASLHYTQLQGAWLHHAQLQGASLDNVQLQGASLDNAQLQGASLSHAQLQGASLDHAQLQGASLDRTDFRNAVLEWVYVWRADDQEIEPTKFSLSTPITKARRRCGDVLGQPRKEASSAEDPDCEWSKADFETLKRRISTTVPEGEGHMREAALKRIDPMLNPDHNRTVAETWSHRPNRESTIDEITQERVKAWQPVGCNPDGAPFVVTALIDRLDQVYGEMQSGPLGKAEVAQLAATFLAAESCGGARGISAGSRTRLTAIMKAGKAAAAR